MMGPSVGPPLVPPVFCRTIAKAISRDPDQQRPYRDRARVGGCNHDQRDDVVDDEQPTCSAIRGALRLRDLLQYAEELGLDMERFREHLRKRKGVARIAEDVESADRSGVTGTPSFFINGRRH
jgi:hypothetical protein